MTGSRWRTQPKYLPMCQQYTIALIAEEMSLDALHKWEHTESICKQVADALGIPHVY